MNGPSSREFGQVDRFLVGAIGEPGQRTFYVFIESRGMPVWFKCEKGQAAALGEQGLELLTKLGWKVDQEVVDTMLSAASDLPTPSGPDDIPFRILSIALRIDDRDHMTFLLEGDGDEDRAVFSITAEQLRTVAIMALRAVQAGRAQCPECMLPEDPSGHDCPSSNGHRLSG